MPTNITSSGDGLCIISWIDPTARLKQLGFCRNLSGEFEIDLTPKRVDAGNLDAYVVAEAELAAVAAAFDEVFFLVVVVVVVSGARYLALVAI